jgi:3-phytase
MRAVFAALLFSVPAGAIAQTVDIPAAGETIAVASRDDAADDPAIWIDRRNPARSLIVATDKKAGLNVYALDGTLKSSFAAGRVNNVDLRTVDGRIVVAASDRNDRANGRLALFTLDPKTATLREIARPPAGPGEAYGLCLWQPRRGLLNAFIVFKNGTIRQFEIAGPTAKPVRTMKLATQSEGCVADDRTGQLFVGEEDVGIWQFGAAKTDPVEPKSVAKDDGTRLVADVEGLAIAAEGKDGGYLVASSQGDNAYALWRLPDLAYVGRFRIAANGAIGGTQETDGIEISTTRLPGFPDGIMIAQDGNNAPLAQNFKLVRWADVKRALKLR